MKDRVRDILTDLDRVRQDLRALSDDIWLNIDHNDTAALKRGFDFKLAYNTKVAEFDRIARDIASLLEQAEGPALVRRIPQRQHASGSTPINDDGRGSMPGMPHSLDENFTHTRPVALVFRGETYDKIDNWRNIYELVCGLLAKHDQERFALLPDQPLAVGKRGMRYFGRDPSKMYSPIEIALGVYADAQLSANSIRNLMRQLLEEFGIPFGELAIFLRGDSHIE